MLAKKLKNTKDKEGVVKATRDLKFYFQFKNHIILKLDWKYHYELMTYLKKKKKGIFQLCPLKK